MATKPPALLIGGIRATLWVSRRVRLNDKRRCAGHFMRGTLISIEPKAKAFVLPDNHNHPVLYSLSDVHPWWSQNPDLKKPNP